MSCDDWFTRATRPACRRLDGARVRLVLAIGLLGCLSAPGGALAKTAGPTGATSAVGPSLALPLVRQTTRAGAVDGWVAITTVLAPRSAFVRTGLIALEVYDARARRAGRRAFAGLTLGRGTTVRRSFWWPAPVSGIYHVAVRVLGPNGAATLL